MTVAIIFITVIISMISFNNSTLAAKLIFNPYQISQHKQYYRFISSGFIHADFFHLLINMLVLYSFGTLVERKFEMLMGEAGKTFFVIYYLLGLIISILPTYFKQQSNYLYNGLGASGSVSAVLFSFILFYPWQKIYLYGILGIPGILAGVAYLIFSSYQDKKGRDNINHNAHFWGAIYGFVFPITVSKQVFFDFWDQLTTIHL